ncbi:MAG: hypothetical protein WC635_01875 [Bacteriovorax sp.]
MLKSILSISIFTLLSCSTWADAIVVNLVNSPDSIVEHQVRLCDEHKSILNKLHITTSEKKREVIYVETRDRFYQQNGWTIRIKIKTNTAEIDLKKRLKSNASTTGIEEIECELDKHGSVLQKTCSIHHEISPQKLKKIIDDDDSWTSILSKSQEKWLTKESALREDALFHGTLNASRYELSSPDFSEISLDIVHLSSNPFYTYHEISTRYLLKDLSRKSALFLNYVKSKKLIACPNQIDWEINKFDVMSILNHIKVN